MKKEIGGITLIALVITIIILLILAGISIISLTGEKGILKKSSTAQGEEQKMQYKEILQIIGNGLRSEKILENLSEEEYMHRYQKAIEEEIRKGDIFKGAIWERKNERTIKVITKEGYVYFVTEDEVRFLGKQGDNVPPALQEGNIDFVFIPNGWTNQEIKVEIISKIDSYLLQYSVDGVNWKDYKEEIMFSENGTIYARLINELEETGGSVTKTISKIDKRVPDLATIVLSNNNVQVGTDIIATITQNDDESGVDVGSSRWVLTTSDTPIGTQDIIQYTGGVFSKEKDETLRLTCSEAGDYYLHVLTQDKAGNRVEKISDKIIVIKHTKEPLILFDTNNATEKNFVKLTPTSSYPFGTFEYINSRIKMYSSVGVQYHGGTSTWSGTVASTKNVVNTEGYERLCLSIPSICLESSVYYSNNKLGITQFIFGLSENAGEGVTSFPTFLVSDLLKSPNNAARAQFTTSGIYSLDISEYVGSYYVLLRMTTGTYAGQMGNVQIDKIWLE